LDFGATREYGSTFIDDYIEVCSSFFYLYFFFHCTSNN